MVDRILVVNYKQYLSAFGKRGLEIALSAERVWRKTGVNVVLAVPFTEISRISEKVEIDVISQHVDPFGYGAYTGRVIAPAIKEAGGKGSLLNHSERQVSLDDAYKAIRMLHNENLYAVACGSEALVSAALSIMGADMIAMEPPELIGTGRSVSKTKPEAVKKTVHFVRKTGFSGPVLVGAGIVSGEDVRKSVELGADGVLVASAVMKSSDPEGKMLELAEGLLD